MLGDFNIKLENENNILIILRTIYLAHETKVKIFKEKIPNVNFNQTVKISFNLMLI